MFNCTVLPDVLASEPPHTEAVSPRLSSGALPTFVVLGAFWFILIDRLRLDWETNPQYSYGWLVPLLALYLFWNRWPSRPPVRPVQARGALITATLLLALCFWPTRLIHESTPEWSTVAWAMALEVVGLTLAAIAYAAGGPSVRHFAWPVCFFLVAVAWPMRFETALTQGLMQALARITVELLSWAGVAARAQGNLIQLPDGVVGVDEACSGVRSLQSMLMASLFLGELHRLDLWRRCALLLCGLALALVFNIVRALILVTVTIRSGYGGLASWHDPAGFSILAISFVLLCLVVKWMRQSGGLAATEQPHAPWRPLPRPVWVILAGCLLLAEISTEAWYRSHETAGEGRFAWRAEFPTALPSFADRPIAPTVSKLLAYNVGREAGWQGEGGTRWQMFAFAWHPGRSSTISARQHRPEVCLPAGGQRLVAELPATVVPVGSTQVAFRTYQFDYRGEPAYVFFCLAEAGTRDLPSTGLPQDYSRQSRLARVRLGQRNRGQQSVEIIVNGYRSVEEALAGFRRTAPQLLAPAG